MTDNEDITIDVDATYRIELKGKTEPKYTISQQISAWLQKNLEGLTDDHDKTLFSKVNTGYNEETLKTFGGKPVCDVYINNVEYSDTFEVTQPDKVNTIILFYFKGANNNSYMEACALHDYIMQEFINNEDFQELEGIVSETRIKNSELRIQPIRKKWGVVGAFELSHWLILRY